MEMTLLNFASAPTPAALEILEWCLELAKDIYADIGLDDWKCVHTLSSRAISREQGLGMCEAMIAELCHSRMFPKIR